MDVINVTSIVLSAAAVFIALIVAFLQFRVHGPRIFVVNASDVQTENKDGHDDVQRCIALPYAKLPSLLTDKYADVAEHNPNYAALAIMVTNTGDKTGFVYLGRPQLAPDTIHISHYDYLVVPPNDIVSHLVLMRNLPNVAAGSPIEVTISINGRWGGSRGQKKHLFRKPLSATVKALVVHPSDR